jgi:hypothetical protein
MTHSPLQRIIHQFSPKVWLSIAVGSLVLAAGAGLLLLSRLDGPRQVHLGSTFDAIELFVRDTIRLSFKSRNPKGFQDIAYVAPKGLLDKSMTFKWIDPAEETPPTPDEQAPVIQALAPLRLLDPTWNPVFAAPPHGKEHQ